MDLAVLTLAASGRGDVSGSTLGAVSALDAFLTGALALIVTPLMHTAKWVTVARHT